MLYYSYTLMFSLFTALLLCCCVSFCSLLDGVCLSGNKRITYLLTYLLNKLFIIIITIIIIVVTGVTFFFVWEYTYKLKKAV